METTDFFRCRIDAMINLRHPLAVLATWLPRAVIEASLVHLDSLRARSAPAIPRSLEVQEPGAMLARVAQPSKRLGASCAAGQRNVRRQSTSGFR